MIPARMPILKAGFWNPTMLGADLIEWLDAEQPAQFNTPTGAITTWTDSVLSRGYTQITAANKPTRSTTSFNGRPGVTFDGTNDELTCPSTTGIPVGSTTAWRWAVLDQQVLAADTANKTFWGIGAGIVTASTWLQRRVTTGTNRFFGSMGTGISSATCTQTSTDFSGRHLVLLKYTGSGNQQAIVDGSAGTAVLGGVSTGTTRATIGASNDITRSMPTACIINTFITTTALSAGNEALLQAYLLARL